MDEIVQLISNLGFPIACAIALFIQMKRQSEQHAAESAKWVEALNANTRAIDSMQMALQHLSREVD